MSRKFYAWWLLAAFLGMAGAAADVAWHFSRLFDEFSWPHNTATSGFLLNIFLLYWALWRNRERVHGAERFGMLLNGVGLLLFLIGIPSDLTWHIIYGVDITTWSPTHLLLFYSACIGQAGILIAWLASPSSRERGAWLITFGIGVVFLSACLFPAYQQEYAAVALDSLMRTGRAPWYVAPDMWRLAGPQAQRLARGGLPDWLYPVYQAAVASFALTVIASAIRWRLPSVDAGKTGARAIWHGFGAATGITLVYLLFRVIARAIFSLFKMPTAVLPWWLLGLAFSLDVALLLAALLPAVRVPHRLPFPAGVAAFGRQAVAWAALGGVAGDFALYAIMAVLRSHHLIQPVAPLYALPAAALVAAVGGAVGGLLSARILWMADQAPVPEIETLYDLVLDQAASSVRRAVEKLHIPALRDR